MSDPFEAIRRLVFGAAPDALDVWQRRLQEGLCPRCACRTTGRETVGGRTYLTPCGHELSRGEA